MISVCMFIVSKDLLISSVTAIVYTGEAIWLNLFATVLFSVCSAITVECCVLYPCCVRVVSSVFAITERRDMVLYEVPLSISFLFYYDGDNVRQLPCVWYYIVVKSRFKHAREECESKRVYVF